jgi:hypothetical protein
MLQKLKPILPDKREFSAELIGRDPNTDSSAKAEGSNRKIRKFR